MLPHRCHILRTQDALQLSGSKRCGADSRMADIVHDGWALRIGNELTGAKHKCPTFSRSSALLLSSVLLAERKTAPLEKERKA